MMHKCSLMCWKISNHISATYGQMSYAGLFRQRRCRAADQFITLQAYFCGNHDLTLAHPNSLLHSPLDKRNPPLQVRTTGQATIGLLNSFQSRIKNSFKFLEQCACSYAAISSREQPLCPLHCTSAIFRAERPRNQYSLSPEE